MPALLAKISTYIEEALFEDTGFSYTMSLITGKNKMVILYCLMKFRKVRFNELKRYLEDWADKTLRQKQKELQEDSLIDKILYPQLSPKVEYSLTARGKSLMTILD